MAQINLTSGEAFTIVDGRNTVSGSTTSAETVTIRGGVTIFTPDFNAGGDGIILAGYAAQYTVQRSGSSVIFRGPNGTQVTFPAPAPNLVEAMNPVVSFEASGQSFYLDSTPNGIFTLSQSGVAFTIGPLPGPVGFIASIDIDTADFGLHDAGLLAFADVQHEQPLVGTRELETAGETGLVAFIA